MRRSPITRHLPVLACVAGVALLVASPALAGSDRVHVAGPLTAYDERVPAGATATVDAAYTPAGDTVVTLQVHGLLPDRSYGVHVNARPCGGEPGDAGPRFQAEPDPVQPSHDVHYANIHNEIWLDLTTDGDGDGEAQRRVAWQPMPQYRPHSVVLHARQTDWRPALAGEAGARLACITVPF